MSRIPRLLAATVVAALTASQAFAQAANQNIAPGVGAGKVLKAQLGIKPPQAPGVCPNVAALTFWVFTNFAGNVNVMIARQGGDVAGPISVQAQPAANGQFMATYSTNIQITQSMNTSYRVLVPSKNGPVMSNWVPLQYDCIIG